MAKLPTHVYVVLGIGAWAAYQALMADRAAHGDPRTLNDAYAMGQRAAGAGVRAAAQDVVPSWAMPGYGAQPSGYAQDPGSYGTNYGAGPGAAGAALPGYQSLDPSIASPGAASVMPPGVAPSSSSTPPSGPSFITPGMAVTTPGGVTSAYRPGGGTSPTPPITPLGSFTGLHFVRAPLTGVADTPFWHKAQDALNAAGPMAAEGSGVVQATANLLNVFNTPPTASSPKSPPPPPSTPSPYGTTASMLRR